MFGIKFIDKLTISFLFFLLFFEYQPLIGGISGKISGKISDKNTKEPLAGVNIFLVGQKLGASTNLNGEYFILPVVPGKYDVQVMMIGYKEVLIKNVEVILDHTTTLNIELYEEIIEGETVVIMAERPVIQKDITSSTQFMSVEEINRLPVNDAREAVWLQTGIFFDEIPTTGGVGSHFQGEQRYSIRGGSQDQVKWFYDGVRASTVNEAQADQAGSFTNINKFAIQEIQILTGGFNAEYGEAQSGIVNVITKEGSDRFTGSLEYIYSPPSQRNFGNYLYDKKTQKEFIEHTLSDGSLDPDWWTPYRQSQIYDYRELSDSHLLFGLGGPLFTVGSSKATFFVSSQFKEEAYALPHPRNSRTISDVLANLSLRISPTIKVKLGGIYSKEAHSSLQRAGDFTNQAKYYRGWGSLLDKKNLLLSASWNHTISANLFYDLKLSYYYWVLKESPSKNTVLGESDLPTLFGYQRFDNYENEPFDAYSFIFDQSKTADDISLIGSLNWQINQENLLKFGIEFRYNKYNEKYAYQFPSFSIDPKYWIRRGLHEKYHPLQFASYLQNKMEFEGMILNLGIRFDYFDPNYTWFSEAHKIFNLSVNPDYNAMLDSDGDQIDENGNVKYSFQNVLEKPRSPVSVQSYFSPRLGVSFPITENTLLHFNYGHFTQIPPVNRMYDFTYWRPVYITKNILLEDEIAKDEGRAPKHIPSNTGDPERVIILSTANLSPEKTVMFEVGFKHNFENLAFLAFTAFYKDVYDQTTGRLHGFDRRIYAYDPFFNQTTSNMFYVSNFPGDYGDARGLEINVQTLLTRNLIFDINYSFSISTEGRASPVRINYDEAGNPEFVYDTDVNLRNATQKTFSRPHILRANIYLNYPNNFKSPLLSNIFKNSTASILYQYISGQAFTFLSAGDPPETFDNHRYPARQTVDTKLEKSFYLRNFHKFSIYAQITNLFNTKNLRSFGEELPDFREKSDAKKKYVETGEITTTDVEGYDISWINYYEPRRFYFGMVYYFGQ